MKKIVNGKNIVKVYGQGQESVHVLDGIDIAISKGEFVAVMGASGCGKSTLLFALSGTDKISKGSIEFDDVDLAKLGENTLADMRRTKMGFIFQQPTMLKNLNILDNIILPSLQESKKDIINNIQKAKKLMDKTGISGLEHRDITEVSGGELQRASICRALMNDPKIIFADEPTGALNSKASEDIMNLLLEVNREGMAIFFVTHDSKVAAKAQRVIFMKDGKVKSELRFDECNENKADDRMAKVIDKMQEINI